MTDASTPVTNDEPSAKRPPEPSAEPTTEPIPEFAADLEYRAEVTQIIVAIEEALGEGLLPAPASLLPIGRGRVTRRSITAAERERLVKRLLWARNELRRLGGDG